MPEPDSCYILPIPHSHSHGQSILAHQLPLPLSSSLFFSFFLRLFSPLTLTTSLLLFIFSFLPFSSLLRCFFLRSYHHCSFFLPHPLTLSPSHPLSFSPLPFPLFHFLTLNPYSYSYSNLQQKPYNPCSLLIPHCTASHFFFPIPSCFLIRHVFWFYFVFLLCIPSLHIFLFIVTSRSSNPIAHTNNNRLPHILRLCIFLALCAPFRFLHPTTTRPKPGVTLTRYSIAFIAYGPLSTHPVFLLVDPPSLLQIVISARPHIFSI